MLIGMIKKIKIVYFIFFAVWSPMILASNPAEESTLIDLNGSESEKEVNRDHNSNHQGGHDCSINTCGVPGAIEKGHGKSRKGSVNGFQSYERSLSDRRNIPSDLIRSDSIDREFNSPEVETSPIVEKKLLGLIKGSVLDAVIEQDILAYPDSKAPVMALVTFPESFRNARLMGLATLDTETKRILIDFQSLILPGDTTSYAFKGITTERSGKLGLKGIHKTEFWKWLWAEALTRTTGGVIEASAERDSTVFGPIKEITPENVAKSGAAKGLESISEKFAEKKGRSTEFTEVSGPTSISISVIE